MNLLDIRTVMFSQLITDAACTVVLTFLWLQNRERYSGLFFWVVDFIFQTTAALLIILRGSIPDWISLGFTSILVVGGALLGYLGLERFIARRSRQVQNYILLSVFILVHFYFIYAHPDLNARDLNLSLGLLVFCAQCAWLMLRRAGRGLTRATQTVGWVFTLFCLVSIIRVLIILASPNPGNDFFQSGLYNTLILMAYQILLIFLTFALVMMVNRRLLAEIKTQEAKFTKVFQSSPNAILISRLSDGQILDVNRTFEEISGYLPAEAVGKTSLALQLWTKETDRQEVLEELSTQGRVPGREFQFRMKSGSERTGLYSAEILVIENERLILSCLSDITERKQAEETIQSVARFPTENPNPVLRVAPDGILLYANEAAFDLLQDWKLELHKPVPETLQDLIRSVFENHTVNRIEIPCRERTFSIDIAPVPEDEYVNLYCRDITEQKLAEETLKDSEKRYRSLFEHMLNGFAYCQMLFKDSKPDDFIYLAVNTAFEKLTGLKGVVGKKVSEVIPGIRESDPELFGIYGRVALTGQPETFETYLEALKMWFSISVYSPQVEYFVAVFDVITERKQTEEKLLYQAALLESVNEAIVASDAEFRLTAWNRAAEALYGWKAGEVLGRKGLEIIRTEWPEADAEAMRRLIAEQGHWHGEATQARKDGSRIPVDVSSLVLRGDHGQITGYISAIRDITERKRIEEELQQTLEELKRSNSELEQFAYVASHDLQEPLRMVSSYMQMLERRYKGSLDADADEFIGFAVDGAQRMQRLINDLLAYSRVGRRGQPFALTSCEGVLVQALDNLQVAVRESKAKITHDPLPEVVADEAQLVELFQNLIGNAVKFHGKKAPRVHVSVDTHETEWVFAVRDDGIGIDPQYAERIFIIFQRLHDRNHYAGTGIGLAICKKIVQRHGGLIWVESQPGKGATFFFTLPKRR